MSTKSESAILTPQDIRSFYRLASPNLRCGRWGSVRRRYTSSCDCLEVLLPSDDDLSGTGVGFIISGGTLRSKSGNH